MAEKIILFDGKDLSGFTHRDGSDPKWDVEFGTATVRPGTGDIVSKVKFGDAHLHVEFRLPYMPDCHGQDRANSGVYVHGCYEVQVLDTYGKADPCDSDCSGIYSLFAPLTNASLPPLEWQTYDIAVKAPRFDADGKLTENAVITVVHNGVVVHNNLVLPRCTPGGLFSEPAAEGPVILQDHGNLVSFRNVWVIKY